MITPRRQETTSPFGKDRGRILDGKQSQCHVLRRPNISAQARMETSRCATHRDVRYSGFDDDSRENPIVNDPIVNDPIVNDPIVNDPIVNDSIVNDSIVNDSIVNDSIVNDPIVNDSIVHDPADHRSPDHESVSSSRLHRRPFDRNKSRLTALSRHTQKNRFSVSERFK